MSHVTENDFKHKALCLLNCNVHRIESESFLLRYHVHFRCSPLVCVCLWNQMVDARMLIPQAKPEHLLWTLLWMFLYESIVVITARIGCSHTTFQKYRDSILYALSELDLVS